VIRSTRLTSAVVLASFAAPFALAAHTHLAIPSTWTLNLKESDFGGVPTPASETFALLADNEKRASYTDVTVDAAGKTWNSRWSGAADGAPHPITGLPGATFSTNAATDVSVMVFPDGMTQTCNFSLTHNKKKFVETCIAKTTDGKSYNQHLVFDRVK
jgi:hypothetical protein